MDDIKLPEGGHLLRREDIQTPGGVYKLIYYVYPDIFASFSGSRWLYTLTLLYPGVDDVYGERHTIYSVVPPSRDYIKWAEDDTFRLFDEFFPRHWDDWATMEYLLEPLINHLEEVLG